MALDKGLVQNINLRANGDQLLAPMRAFGREINKVTKDLNSMLAGFSKGAHLQDNQLRNQVQLLQRLIGEASTLQNILTGAGNRRRNTLFEGLDEQKLGKTALSASKLKRELANTKTAGDALEVRLAQLYKSFGKLADAGRRVGQTDINKALRTDEAIRQVRRLEQELSRLDARQKITGKPLTGDAAATRAQLQTAYDQLTRKIQNPSRVNWATEIAGVEALTLRLKSLTRAQQESAIAAGRAADARQKALLAQTNLSEPQLQAQINRQSSGYAFTKDQAKSFNIPQLNREIEQGKQKLLEYQAAMSKAFAQNRSPQVIDRLGQSFERLKARVAEATAARKAFDALPEQRMKALNAMLFGGGGLAFAGRIAGASVITTGIFAAINAISSGIHNVVEFEDALHKLQAISGATDQQMQRLSASILDVGSTSRYSVLEITEAATQIAQAGYSAQETGKVLKDALTLAAASGASPSEAVDTLTSTLGAFNLQANESTHVVDVLVNGLNRSKLSITQMQAAIQYAGATAAESGVQFEELTAIAASLANAGIRSGSTIGTGMRQLLIDLKTPTEDFKNTLKDLGLTMADVDVKSLGLAKVVKNLTDAGFTAEQAYSSFEVRAASSFLAFRNQIDVYDELALSIAKSGAAAAANEKAMGSLSAKITELKNNLLKLITQMVGPLEGAAKLVVDAFGGIVKVIGAINEATDGMLVQIGLIAAATALGGPIAGVITFFTLLAGSIQGAADRTEELHSKTSDAEAAFDSQKQTLSSVDDAIANLINRSQNLKGNQAALQAETINLSGRFKDLGGELSGVALNYDNLLQAMLRYRGEALRQAALNAEGVKTAASVERGDVAKQLTSNVVSFRGLHYVGGPAKEAAALGSRYDLGVGLGAQNDIQAAINNLSKLKNQNAGVTSLIQLLQERLDLMRRVDDLNSKISVSDKQISLYNERTSKAGQARDQEVLATTQGVTEGLNLNNGTPGSGDKLLNSTLANAQVQINNFTRQLAALDPNSSRAMDIQRALTELKGQVARVTAVRAQAGRDLMKNEKAGAGENLTGSQVADLLRKEFTGANPYSYNKRPYSEQVDLYNKYKAGKGPLAAKPGTSHHGDGTALDMTPIRGMDIDQVTKFLESRGLEIVEALNERDPQTGRFHWHFAWKPKTSSYAKRQDSEADKAARELQQLMEEEAKHQSGTAQSKVDTILAQAKSGSAPISTLSTNFDSALAGLRDAKLNEFDVAHPTAGLSATLLKQRDLARKALEEQITQEAVEAHAQLWKSIADYSGKVLDEALASLQEQFDALSQSVENDVAAVESQGKTLGNNINKNRFGVGAAYRQQQNEFNARLEGDKKLKHGLDWQELGATVELNKFMDDAEKLRGTEGYTDALNKQHDAEKKLRDIQQQRDALQRSINERTQEYADIPLGDRLRDSIAAWADSSGAMDSWGKTLENSVGPALDEFSGQLATMFTSIVDGTATVKQALAGFLKAFAQFVVQIIAKALALMAVKAILGLFGLQLDSSGPGGTIIKHKSFNGGLVGANDNQPRKAFGGGHVSRGVSNRDSANYDLAYGEYVVRNKSVRELGLPFMDAINREGAKGLKKMGAAGTAFTNIQAPRQETNVWVVSEKQQASMGPNDVLVTVHRDIMQNGTTKKLIKQVAQGG